LEEINGDLPEAAVPRPANREYFDRNSSGSPKNVAKDAENLFDQKDASADSVPVSVQPIRRGAEAKKTISDLHFPDAIFAVKESTACQDLKELQVHMVSRLGQNSEETRVRYARFVIRWFFADGLDGIARKTWVAYQDEKILIDILRYLYLVHEPVMGLFVSECLFPIELGMRVPASLFDRFLSTHYGGAQTKKTTQRVKSEGAEQRLKELGIKLPVPPEPFGTYVEAVQKGKLLFLTGMLPTEGRGAKFIGRVRRGARRGGGAQGCDYRKRCLPADTLCCGN
jgi:hypothetical protein